MDVEFRTKMALGKLPVTYLSEPGDFTRWHLALRKIVSAFGMGDALLYSVPMSEVDAFIPYVERRERAAPVAHTTSSSSSSGSSSSPTSSSTSTSASATVTPTTPAAKRGKRGTATGTETTTTSSTATTTMTSDTAAGLAANAFEAEAADAEFKAMLAERAARTHVTSGMDIDLMRMLGVTRAQDEFFSSSTVFYNTRLCSKEKDPESFYRTEIWNWMESSVSKGQYRTIAKNISPVYDIKKLYTRLVEVANKASIISCLLEYKKVFTLVAKDDLFQYYEELLQQLRVVKAQAETLDIKMDLPANVEQNLLLIAAWQDPRYRDIAEEISRKKRAFIVDELLRDLHQQQLLTPPQRSLRQGEGAIRTGCEDQGSQGKYEAVLCFSQR